MPIMKVRGQNLYITSSSMSDLNSYLTKLSFESSELVIGDQVTEVPYHYEGKVTRYNVKLYQPRKSNADHQRNYRQRMLDQGKVLVRYWVTKEHAKQIKELVEKLNHDK